MANNFKKDRIAYLDVIRVFAILLVIGMHSPIPYENANGYVYSFMTLLCTPCNALFFMVSGALLLPMKDESWKEFMEKRLPKVFFPVLFWSIITLIVQYFQGVKSMSEVITDFCLLPFYPHANYNYWFVYVIIGLYLLTPIISPFIKNNISNIGYMLFLWFVTLILLLLSCFNLKLPKTYNNMFYYFGGWAGYYVLGYYLSKRNKRNNDNIIKWIPFILFPFITYFILKYINVSFDYQELMGYISLLTVLSASAWFSILKHIDWHSHVIEMMSNLCFGVYLCHILIRDSIVCFLPVIFSHGSIFLITSIWILTSILSFLFVYILSKLPYSKYIIGFYSRK